MLCWKGMLLRAAFKRTSLQVECLSERFSARFSSVQDNPASEGGALQRAAECISGTQRVAQAASLQTCYV
jgi:hypothetical protein